jgi:hypothetical protein
MRRILIVADVEDGTDRLSRNVVSTSRRCVTSEKSKVLKLNSYSAVISFDFFWFKALKTDILINHTRVGPYKLLCPSTENLPCIR